MHTQNAQTPSLCVALVGSGYDAAESIIGKQRCAMVCHTQRAGTFHKDEDGDCGEPYKGAYGQQDGIEGSGETFVIELFIPLHFGIGIEPSFEAQPTTILEDPFILVITIPLTPDLDVSEHDAGSDAMPLHDAVAEVEVEAIDAWRGGGIAGDLVELWAGVAATRLGECVANERQRGHGGEVDAVDGGVRAGRREPRVPRGRRRAAPARRQHQQREREQRAGERGRHGG